MATSGSTNFNMTRDEIIKDALYKLRVLGADENVSSEDLNLAARQLNRMIKSWQNRGIRLWTYTEGVLFLDTSSQSYDLNTSSGDHAANASDVVETTLSAAEASGQTVLSVTSSTGMAASDNVGIELDDGTRQWTTIVSVDSSTQITVTASLTGAAASGNSVYTYTTRMDRPLRVFNVRRKDNSNIEKPIPLVSRQEYFDIVDKATNSDVSIAYYDPQLGTGKFYIWPTSAEIDDRITFSYQRLLEDFDATGDNPDLPSEWLDAIVWNLAVRIAPDFGRSDVREIQGLAAQLLFDAMTFDAENEGIALMPDQDFL